MDKLTQSFRAHFDGKVIVPDEPVNLPLNTPFAIKLQELAGGASPKTGADFNEQNGSRGTAGVAAIEAFISRNRVAGASIPSEALRRENLYGDEGR